MTYPPHHAPAPWPGGGGPAHPTAVPPSMTPPGLVPGAGGMLAPPRRGHGVGTVVALVLLGVLVLVAIAVIGL